MTDEVSGFGEGMIKVTFYLLSPVLVALFLATFGMTNTQRLLLLFGSCLFGLFWAATKAYNFKLKIAEVKKQ